MVCHILGANLKSTIDNSRETIGSQILNTQKEHEKLPKIEISNVTEEFGKSYMRGLYDNMEKYSFTYDKYYILVITKPSPIIGHRGLAFFYEGLPTIPPMQENSDVWFVDFTKQKLELLWSLPAVKEFDFILAHEDQHDKDLIKWIKIYKKYMSSK